jgi:hypothetical protein
LKKLHPEEMLKVGEKVLLDLLNEGESFCKLESRFDRNYPRLIAQMVFSMCLMIPDGANQELVEYVSKAVVSTVYSSFKA